MVIFYLQQLSPRVIPTVRELREIPGKTKNACDEGKAEDGMTSLVNASPLSLPETEAVVVNGWNCSFMTDPEKVPKIEPSNRSSLGKEVSCLCQWFASLENTSCMSSGTKLHTVLISVLQTVLNYKTVSPVSLHPLFPPPTHSLTYILTHSLRPFIFIFPAELLIGFFKYYESEFDFATQVVSPLEGRPLLITEVLDSVKANFGKDFKVCRVPMYASAPVCMCVCVKTRYLS